MAQSLSAWQRRSERALKLAQLHPEAREALEFCAGVAALQHEIAVEHAPPGDANARITEWLHAHAPAKSDHWDGFVLDVLAQTHISGECPECSGPPVVTLLREASHGARRSRICGRCLAESPAARLGCLTCGEQRVEALPVYRAEATDPARIDACDSCRVYVKTIDLTRDGEADPVADDVASVSLDLWARERGYRRLRLNLLRL